MTGGGFTGRWSTSTRTWACFTCLPRSWRALPSWCCSSASSYRLTACSPSKVRACDPLSAFGEGWSAPFLTTRGPFQYPLTRVTVLHIIVGRLTPAFVNDAYFLLRHHLSWVIYWKTFLPSSCPPSRKKYPYDFTLAQYENRIHWSFLACTIISKNLRKDL